MFMVCAKYGTLRVRLIGGVGGSYRRQLTKWCKGALRAQMWCRVSVTTH